MTEYIILNGQNFEFGIMGVGKETIKIHFDSCGTMTATLLHSHKYGKRMHEMKNHVLCTIPNFTEDEVRTRLDNLIDSNLNGQTFEGLFACLKRFKAENKPNTELEKIKTELEKTKAELKKWKNTMTEEEEIQLACIRAKEGAKKRLQELYDARPLIGETLM